MIGQEYLTTRQAKELLGGVCDATLWRYVKEGYIEKFKLGKKNSSIYESQYRGLYQKRGKKR